MAAMLPAALVPALFLSCCAREEGHGRVRGSRGLLQGDKKLIERNHHYFSSKVGGGGREF